MRTIRKEQTERDEETNDRSFYNEKTTFITPFQSHFITVTNMFHLLIFIYKCQRCSIICIMQKNTLCLQTHQKWGDKVLKINPSLPTLVSGQKRQLMTKSRGNTKLHLWLHQPRSPTWGRHGGLATLAGMEMVKAPLSCPQSIQTQKQAFCFFKMGQSRPSFCLFSSFYPPQFQ